MLREFEVDIDYGIVRSVYYGDFRGPQDAFAFMGGSLMSSDSSHFNLELLDNDLADPFFKKSLIAMSRGPGRLPAFGVKWDCRLYPGDYVEAYWDIFHQYRRDKFLGRRQKKNIVNLITCYDLSHSSLSVEQLDVAMHGTRMVTRYAEPIAQVLSNLSGEDMILEVRAKYPIDKGFVENGGYVQDRKIAEVFEKLFNPQRS
ncbi:MAG: hypothetical protein A2W11_05285 [Ignavibacteria bacterium RBG_16_35_7]|nr:MAG: hypothetical protein A2W11_05285 [Ignavibacteria bacterium RBG_16_35_7]